MVTSCMNCGMRGGIYECVAKAIGYNYSSAYECPYFVPIDVGDKKGDKDCGAVLFPKGHTEFIENKKEENDGSRRINNPAVQRQNQRP